MQHAAAQAVLLAPLDVVDRVVDVVQEDLADAGATLGEPAAPVGQPAVVGADAGEAVLVLVGGRRPGEQDEAREERRDGVGEHDLGRRCRRPRGRRCARSSSQLRTRPPSWRSRNGFLYFSRQASKSSRYFGSRYSRYISWLPPAWQSAEMIV